MEKKERTKGFLIDSRKRTTRDFKCHYPTEVGLREANIEGVAIPLAKLSKTLIFQNDYKASMSLVTCVERPNSSRVSNHTRKPNFSISRTKNSSSIHSFIGYISLETAAKATPAFFCHTTQDCNSVNSMFSESCSLYSPLFCIQKMVRGLQESRLVTKKQLDDEY